MAWVSSCQCAARTDMSPLLAHYLDATAPRIMTLITPRKQAERMSRAMRKWEANEGYLRQVTVVVP